MSIYKIYNDDECYIGKTTLLKVGQRISKHKYNYTHNVKYQCSSKIILSKPNWKWEILESNIEIEKLNEREKYYIENTPNCINVSKVLLTDEERRLRDNELTRKYYRERKEKNPDYYKKYNSILIYHSKMNNSLRLKAV